MGVFFYLKTPLSIEIYSSVSELPENWNDFAVENIFLSKEYLEILEKTAPINMFCHFIGLFKEGELAGIALSQFLDLNKLESFGERDKCVKNAVRNTFLKNFCSHILIIGNNMLTGQNSFAFSNKTNEVEVLQALRTASEKLKTIFKNKELKVHITTFKDFPTEEITAFHQAGFQKYFQFSTQPNMLFEISNH